ncbi:MAG: DUF1707 and DUF2154 domain-containing protein [Colwellia sp.]|nr:DUF1707 and DUF2154 domain-containing protein [Colwellia sp.]
MAVKIADRPIDTVREEVVDQLVMNYSHGELSHEAFERRLDEAMASTSNEELIELVADLELKVDEKYIEQKKEDFKFNYSSTPAQESELLVSIFSGSERSGEWRVAKEIKSVCIFGGCDIDFSEALFTHREVTVKVFCLFGGIDISVPENVKVVSKSFCIFGGMDNKAPSTDHSDAPTIFIEGLVIFGGVDIKLKRTLKERFTAFADGLRKMFS